MRFFGHTAWIRIVEIDLFFGSGARLSGQNAGVDAAVESGHGMLGVLGCYPLFVMVLLAATLALGGHGIPLRTFTIPLGLFGPILAHGAKAGLAVHQSVVAGLGQPIFIKYGCFEF